MKKTTGYTKEKNNWKILIISTITTLSITLGVAITVYELQVLFEKNKKQGEYLEKINIDVNKYFLKKVKLNNQALMFKIENYKQYQQAIHRVYNDNNTSNNIFDLYIKDIDSIKDVGNATVMKKTENFSTVLENADLAFIEDDIKINIAFLELYSNKSLKTYQDKIFESISMIDSLYKNISNDIDASIFKIHDFTYVYQNIDTNKKLLDFFYNLPYPRNTEEKLQNLKVDNKKIAKELSYLTREILEDINIKLNGDKIEAIININKAKAKSFLDY